jgi:dienelactone hydrolase
MLLKRREFLAGCLCSAFAPLQLYGQNPYPGISYRRYHRCLPDYLTSLANEAYELRNRRVAELTSPGRIRDYQSWVRRTFWELVGGMPEKTPLNARVVGSFERPGYRVEKILYESRPGLHIPANLYIPATGIPPFPGVLFQMGHSLNGKAASVYQKCCQGLAQTGFVVLGFDPMGQGERTYYPNEGGYLTRLPSADEEHTKPGRQMLLLGDTSTRLQVWDAVRSLDFLASHPLVDPEKLASTGQSGGGTLTMLLAAVDDRLTAAAASCGNTENVACADFNPPGSTDDAEQNLLYSGPLGFDRWDLLYPLAPKPLLVSVSARDFFGTYSPRYISSGWEEYQKLERVYEVLGRKDHVKWVDTPLPHNLSYEKRLEIYNWFRRWLYNDRTVVYEEPPVRVEEDRSTWVGKTGNVVRDFGGETPFSLNLAASKLVETPSAKPDLAELLKIEPKQSSAGFDILGNSRSGRVEIETVEIQSADHVWLPAWLFLPKNGIAPQKVLTLLEDFGRSVRWKEGDLYQELAAKGIAVCAPDLRWMGDLRPEYGKGARNHASWHQDEEQWSWSSLIFGHPMLGQRVTDLLAVISGICRHPRLADAEIIVAARGQLTVPALCAAAMEEAIGKLYLASGLVSFRSFIETEEYSHPFANIVPGMLRYTDLPQLASHISPRPITLAGTVDAGGRTLNVGEVEEIYADVANLKVLPEAVWNTETMERL